MALEGVMELQACRRPWTVSVRESRRTASGKIVTRSFKECGYCHRPPHGPDEKPLFLPVATRPFRKFESGEKTVEIRNNPGRWKKAVPGLPMHIRRGYSTKDDLWGAVGRVAFADSFDSLPEWARKGAALDGLTGYVLKGERCVAIEFIKE